PPPEIRIFSARRGQWSSTATRRPRCPATDAQNSPAAPAPSTIRSKGGLIEAADYRRAPCAPTHAPRPTNGRPRTPERRLLQRAQSARLHESGRARGGLRDAPTPSGPRLQVRSDGSLPDRRHAHALADR